MRSDNVACVVDLNDLAAYSDAFVGGLLAVFVVEDRPGLRHVRLIRIAESGTSAPKRPRWDEIDLSVMMG